MKNAALVPPPPPRATRPRRGPGYGWLLWPGALALGVTLGVVAYRFVPGMAPSFDYWLALAFG